MYIYPSRHRLGLLFVLTKKKGEVYAEAYPILLPAYTSPRIHHHVSLSPVHARTHFFDVVAGNVIIVVHHLVDDAIRSQFDNTVGHR